MPQCWPLSATGSSAPGTNWPEIDAQVVDGLDQVSRGERAGMVVDRPQQIGAGAGQRRGLEILAQLLNVIIHDVNGVAGIGFDTLGHEAFHHV